MNKKFIRFCVTGTIGTVLGLILLLFFVETLHLPVIFSNTISFCIVFFLSFLIHRTWTFKDKNPKLEKQFFEYLAVSLIGLVMSNTLLYILISQGLWYIYAKVIAIFIVGSWSFLINNFLTFRSKA